MHLDLVRQLNTWVFKDSHADKTEKRRVELGFIWVHLKADKPPQEVSTIINLACGLHFMPKPWPCQYFNQRRTEDRNA